jgi:hypothetical protein
VPGASSANAYGVEDEEALEASAVVGELAGAVEHDVDDLLADGVVTTQLYGFSDEPVVGGSKGSCSWIIGIKDANKKMTLNRTRTATPSLLLAKRD